MTIRKDDGRRLIQISCKPDLYEQVREHCRELDLPITIWLRGLMKDSLAKAARDKGYQ
jgi:hypothetical protein